MPAPTLIQARRASEGIRPDQLVAAAANAGEKKGWLTGLEPATPRITISGTVVLSAENKALPASDFGRWAPRCTITTESSHDEALAAVIEAWPQLPAAVRAGITAMVEASRR